jgi:dipeptidyl aminopeptidase/acylaminoacyl peptidase
VLQGEVDVVVPPDQAELIVKTVQANGGKVKYVVMPGEGHGWRKAETVQRALEEELSFFEEALGLGTK